MDIQIKEFESAFIRSNMSEHQKSILKFNYDARGHTITATQLAQKLDYHHHGPANLHYGKLATKVAGILKVKEMPPEKIGIFVTFLKVSNEWNWILKPEVCQALENLDWVEPQGFSIPEEESENVLNEGAVKRVLVNYYERSPRARTECIRHYGALCQICSLDLGAAYGPIGKGYIHVHHMTALSEIGENYQIDPVNDLIPVCPNCHAMLHRRTPAFSPDELKDILKSTKC